MEKVTPNWIEEVWRKMMDEDVLCGKWQDLGSFQQWFLDTRIDTVCTFRRNDPNLRMGPDNCIPVPDFFVQRDYPTEVVGPENPAYQQYREMREIVDGLMWVRFYEDTDLEYSMKGTTVVTIVPDQSGFDVLLPEGPDYELMDILERTEDGGLHIHADSHTAIGNIVLPIFDAYVWADSLMTDEEWFLSE